MHGRCRWYIADGYLPSQSSHGVESHESVCFLNAGARDASVLITFFFEDRPPLGPVTIVVAAARTAHVRLTDIDSLSGLTLHLAFRSRTSSRVMYRLSFSTRGWIRRTTPTHSPQRSRTQSDRRGAPGPPLRLDSAGAAVGSVAPVRTEAAVQLGMPQPLSRRHVYRRSRLGLPPGI